MSVATHDSHHLPGIHAHPSPPIIVEATTPGVEEIVTRIAHEVTNLGGVIDSCLVVAEHEGHVTLGSAEGHEGRRFISLPFDALIPVGDLVWESSPDVALADGADSLSVPQRTLLALHIELWNITAKMEQFRGTHPKTAAANDAHLLGQIHRLRPTFTPADSTDAMLRTRTFGLRRGADAQRQSVIMPILELADHHPDGAPYRTDGGRLESDYRFVDETRVAYVRYGPWRDAMDLACLYGFSSNATLFFVSAPIAIELGPFGSLTVRRDGHRGSSPHWQADEGGLSVNYLPLHVHEGLFAALIQPVRTYLEDRGMDRTESVTTSMRVAQTLLHENHTIVADIHDAALASTEPGARVLAEAAAHQLRVIDAVWEGA